MSDRLQSDGLPITVTCNWTADDSCRGASSRLERATDAVVEGRASCSAAHFEARAAVTRGSLLLIRRSPSSQASRRFPALGPHLLGRLLCASQVSDEDCCAIFG